MFWSFYFGAFFFTFYTFCQRAEAERENDRWLEVGSMSAAASVAVALLVVAVVGSVSRPVSHKLTLANRAVSSRSVISISPPTHPPGKMEIRIEFVLSFLATTALLGFLLQTVLYSILCLSQCEANIYIYITGAT